MLLHRHYECRTNQFGPLCRPFVMIQSEIKTFRRFVAKFRLQHKILKLHKVEVTSGDHRHLYNTYFLEKSISPLKYAALHSADPKLFAAIISAISGLLLVVAFEKLTAKKK